MNRNKIAALIFAVSTVCVVSAHSENAYATEHKNSNQLEENNQTRSVKKGQVINVSTNLRIRKSPNTSSDVIGYLTNGEIFNIDGKEGSWYKINANGKVGYIHGDYVKEVSGNSNSSSNNSGSNSNLDTSLAGKKGTVVNVSTSLRVRQSPSTNSSVVGSLRGGQTFEIKGKSGSWYYINANGTTGYIHGDYVQVGESSSNNGGQSSENNSGMDTSLAGKTGKVVNVSTSLRIRQSPSTSSSVVGSLSAGQTFKINGKNGAWYNIDAQGTKGHVHGDYVQVLSGNEGSNNSNNNQSGNSNNNLDESYNGKTGKVVNVTTNLRLRSQPNTSSSVLAYLLPNEKFTLKGKTSSGWFKVNYNGKVGYLNEEYVKIVSSDEGSNGNQGGSTGGGQVNQSKYEQVLSIMKSHIGSPYIYGGSGEVLTSSLLSSLRRTFPDHAARGFYDIPSSYLNGNYRAFDCSGLMQWSFRQAGISLGRTTWDQINNGYEVSPSNAKPGDLLFFSNLGHVGMYIGNGQWIEAPNKGKFVSITSVPWSKIGRARRVL
ncbi:SH3 domain-containing protein [Clostridium perfringens]|uniref:SH3 domain-containing protein n=1 Tax=Clostridium perfringens TaxID=1502 RepID=A0A8H9QX35_CLOPF|nr:SH3 domain-containing protein [Clostridium perfringens]MDK0980938.1 SH3 domain-containing protein [Clostridium perfringens]MDM0453942.1 SH3 domain-containing protein [Clostridium perfringens]MDM0459687.1 SH3 domain-containing protein [Clostridium perfringens]MDM0468611.1 SH3 domain-containing protein [Clostridium perfringens]MDU3019931.1 SH3 domain-containing protein [Clostridium perfringens]